MLPIVEQRVSQWGLSEELAEFRESVEDPWQSKDIAEVWRSLEEQMLGRPFSDLGARREVSFKALGVNWKLQWDNTYEVTAAAEQFLAVLQIILADLAGLDLCLLRTTVDVDIQPANDHSFLLELVPSNNSTKWRLLLPVLPGSEGAGLELSAEVTAAATTLLRSASLFPDQRLLEVLEGAFRRGLSIKVFSVDRYERLYREFTSREMFDSSERHLRSVPESGRNFSPVLHRQLEWVGGPGPGYSKVKADAWLRNRYESSVISIQITLESLVQNKGFQELVRALRGEGWLDWHILQAVMNIVLNYRVQRAQRLGLAQREIEELAAQWFREPEKENGVTVPAEEFSKENLERYLQLSMLSTVRSYGLELPHQTPDFAAIRDFLGERYRYWIDDVDHPDYGL